MKLATRHALCLMAAIACGLFFSGGNSAFAQNASIIYGVTTSNTLVSFSSATPDTLFVNTPITGLQPGETVLGIDFRPANGQLYALGSTSRLYTIDLATGAATQVGSPGAFTLNGTEFGFDFNPVPDRIRVVSNADQNLRLNPNDGTLTATDTPLQYAGGDVNGGANPNVVASGYINSVAGATATTLYGIDSNLDILVTQIPPNSGTLNTVGPLGVDTGEIASLDIVASQSNTAYAALTTGGASSILYTINLTTGAATPVGATPIGGAGGPQIRGIAAAPAVASGGVIVSEFRFRGPGGSTDEYIELYNTTTSDIIVQGDNGSAGWTIDRSTLPTATTPGVLDFVTVIPNGQVIPARGHYLIVNPLGYSLNSYALDDLQFNPADPEDIEDNAGLALFRTADFDAINSGAADSAILDQVGFFDPNVDPAGPNSNRTFYGEGNLLTAISVANEDFAFFRSLITGFPRDTADNASDFTLVSPSGVVGSTPAVLGAAGPENAVDPIQRNGVIVASIIDQGCAGVSTDPNSACAFVRIGTPVPNGTLGTLSLRRRFTNRLNESVTRLRFRIVNITTLGNNTAEESDLRALNSTDTAVPDSGGNPVNLRGTTVETPPVQPNGGALNSSLAVGFINPGQPISGNGGTIDVQFLLGVNQRNGRFRFLVNIEAVSTPSQVGPAAEKSAGPRDF